VNKILVVNVNWIGDVIFSSPIFKALKREYPGAEISCLAVPRVKNILECIENIDHIIEYDEEGKHKGLFAKCKLINQLRSYNFDAVFLLHRSITRALLMFFCGIPKRIGYDEKKRGWLLSHRIRKLEGVVHRSDYYLNVIEDFGIEVVDRSTSLDVKKDDVVHVNQFLESFGVTIADYLIVINPGGNWDLKRWDKSQFSLLTKKLMEEEHIKVVLSGSKDDVNLALDITKNLSEKPIELTGLLNLNECVALMKRANCVISSDSGPLHIASSVGTDVIGIFGPTLPAVTGPRGRKDAVILRHNVGCNTSACYFLDCQDNVCMQSVTVKEVLDAFRKIKNK